MILLQKPQFIVACVYTKTNQMYGKYKCISFHYNAIYNSTNHLHTIYNIRAACGIPSSSICHSFYLDFWNAIERERMELDYVFLGSLVCFFTSRSSSGLGHDISLCRIHIHTTQRRRSFHHSSLWSRRCFCCCRCRWYFCVPSIQYSTINTVAWWMRARTHDLASVNSTL